MTTVEGLPEALARLELLEGRLQAVLNDEQASSTANVGDMSTSVKQALAAYQAQILPRLLEIRAAIVSGGGDVATIRAERDAAVAENIKLKRDGERMQYRIQHLIKELNTLDGMEVMHRGNSKSVEAEPEDL